MSMSLQLTGALLVLASFVPGRWALRPAGRRWLSFLGASLLAIDAVAREQWGIVLLAGAWVLYSLWGLVAWARGRPVGGQEPA
ncbi:hypothetical protein U9R90_27700 [Streptomyces sp. E11-3]|uniref:hypothetical protein n=1 Tax=Streptomyces sp. E11-3 TaxID=3110112 RepID=UPI00397F02C9